MSVTLLDDSFVDYPEVLALSDAQFRSYLTAILKNHADKARSARQAIRSRRRARERGAAGTASTTQIAQRIAYYHGRCHICHEPGADSIDHVIPLARGGSNWPANLRPAHRSCNSRKGTR